MIITKALSIRHPWIWTIMEGYKNIEIRKWKPDKLEWIALHASKKFDYKGYQYINEKIQIKTLPEPESFKTGEILGIARIEGIIPFTNQADFWFYRHKHLNNPRWWRKKCYGWVFADVLSVSNMKCKGKLGLFTIPKFEI